METQTPQPKLHHLNTNVPTPMWETLKRIAKLKSQLDNRKLTPTAIVREALVEYLAKRGLLEQ